MHRRALLAAPAVAPALAALPAAAQSAPRIVSEDAMVPSGDPGIELFLRNKRPESLNAFQPNRTLLMVHGATYPAHTAFDLPLGGVSWMDYIAGRGFDVWSLDLRGYGRSSRPPEMAQPATANGPVTRGETAVADIAAAASFIRERRGLPRLTALGYSWGTALMGRYAADNAALVERLVLYAPVWLRQTASLADPGGDLGAYRMVTVEAARQTPPALRAPNGSVADGREYWAAGKPFYDPAKITAPTLLVLGEWDQDTPPYMANALFPLLTGAASKRLVILGEGTHGMWMERNRGALFQAVQVFLEETAAA
jgi:pimeloyl-ACP methyl ester carboxylesterase